MLFRLLHISDLHLCLRPNRENIISLWEQPRFSTVKKLVTGKLSLFPASYDPILAEACARFAHEHKDITDAIVLSGDLATTGLTEDLKVASEFLELQGNSYLGAGRRPTLKGASDALFIIPGNHDRYRDVWANAGCTVFDETFKARWGTQHPRVHHTVLRKGDALLALVAADFCLRKNEDADGFFQAWGQGRVYTDIVQELVNRTASLRQRFSEIAIVWVVHFPPISGCHKDLRLIDYENVEKAAADNNIKYILSGHMHSNVVISNSFDTKIVCAGSATCKDDGNGNWVHTVEFDVHQNNITSFRKTDYRWSDDAGDFVEFPVRPDPSTPISQAVPLER